MSVVHVHIKSKLSCAICSYVLNISRQTLTHIILTYVYTHIATYIAMFHLHYSQMARTSTYYINFCKENNKSKTNTWYAFQETSFTSLVCMVTRLKTMPHRRKNEQKNIKLSAFLAMYLVSRNQNCGTNKLQTDAVYAILSCHRI